MFVDCDHKPDEVKHLIDIPPLIQARSVRGFPAFRSTAIELLHNKYLSTQAAFYRLAEGQAHGFA